MIDSATHNTRQMLMEQATEAGKTIEKTEMMVKELNHEADTLEAAAAA